MHSSICILTLLALVLQVTALEVVPGKNTTIASKPFENTPNVTVNAQWKALGERAPNYNLLRMMIEPNEDTRKPVIHELIVTMPPAVIVGSVTIFNKTARGSVRMTSENGKGPTVQSSFVELPLDSGRVWLDFTINERPMDLVRDNPISLLGSELSVTATLDTGNREMAFDKPFFTRLSKSVAVRTTHEMVGEKLTNGPLNAAYLA
ncbi:hypothetical protein RI367_008023 [Sorochytrium milnesiophthora]